MNRSIVAGTVRPDPMHMARSAAASRNELATAIVAAEDVIDPRGAAPDGPDPEPFDEMTGPMTEPKTLDRAMNLGLRMVAEALAMPRRE